jgi:hypothetical protein
MKKKKSRKSWIFNPGDTDEADGLKKGPGCAGVAQTPLLRSFAELKK